MEVMQENVGTFDWLTLVQYPVNTQKEQSTQKVVHQRVTSIGIVDRKAVRALVHQRGRRVGTI